MIKTKLIKLLSDSGKYIVSQVLWQWISLILQIIIVFRIGAVLDGVLKESVTGQLIGISVAVIALCIAGRFVCDRMTVKASFAASLDVKRILRENIYRKLLRLGASYREKVPTAEVVQMSVEGVEQLETYYGRYLSQLFYSLLAPLTLFAVLFHVSWQASLVLLIFVPLIPGSIMAVQKIAKKLLSKYWGAYAELGDNFLEDLQGLTTLKIYKADEAKAAEMDRMSEHFRKITMKVLTMQLNSTSIMDIMAYGGAAAGMIVVIRHFLAGDVTFGGALCICLLASEFFIPLRILGSFFHIAMNGMAASDRIFALLEMEEPERGRERLEAEQVGIHFDNVSFSYGDKQVLKDVSAAFPPGSFISLVGQSGSGKSTIAGIIMGRNRGYSGSIMAGGKELSSLNEGSLMSHITMVSASSTIFKGAVRENLRLGNSDATDEKMWEALEKVRLSGFLREQEGLETILTENGSNLSGGQRQRLALARAILHDMPAYIFDEATSNIDMESEEMIMDVITELAKTKTVILISHRLANTASSDYIYVLSGGKVAEKGTYDELMAAQGTYYRMFTAQRELEEYGRSDD
ncbi:MAG: ABC transporter ATP-binding protein/permease [Firmicutes bacterium]|nr:ABC transporter ATP-binding protein/permease [Bacillota bacterium]